MGVMMCFIAQPNNGKTGLKFSRNSSRVSTFKHEKYKAFKGIQEDKLLRTLQTNVITRKCVFTTQHNPLIFHPPNEITH